MNENDLLEEDSGSSRIILPVSADSKQAGKPPKKRNVLVIEDNKADFHLIRRSLKNFSGVEFNVIHATCLEDGLERLIDSRIHVALLDLGLPDSDGLETFRSANTHAPHVPIIILSGLTDELIAVNAVNEGAQDYLVKGKVDGELLLRSISYAITRHATQWKLKAALLNVKSMESDLRNVLSNNVDAILVVDNQGVVHFRNAAADRLFGRKSGELEQVELGVPLVHGETTELDLIRTGGGQVPVEMRVVAVSWRGRACHLVTLRDLTQQRSAEARRARLASIVNSTDDAIISTDLDGTLQSWNPGAEKMLGYTADEAIGRHISMLWSAEEPEDGRDILALVKRGESVTQFETTRVHKDGRSINVSLTISSIKNSQGEVLGIAGILRDITDRKQTEANLKASEQQFRSIAESANDAFIVANSSGDICSWNNSSQAIFGYSEAEVLGKPLTIMMPQRYREPHNNGFERFNKSGEARVIGRTVELEGLRKDGSEFPLELALSSWQATEGRFFCGIVRDITDRKLAEEDRVKRLEAEREISIARDVQTSLFPARAPEVDGLEIAGAVFPADKASGDYYDFIPMRDEQIGVVVADVSGHGLGPALLMSQTQAQLRVLAETHDDVGEILTHANRLFRGDTPARFVTLLLALIDPRARTLVHAGAGHRGHILTAAGEVELLGSTGIPLGVTEGSVITSAPARTLTTGDIIVLTTDGIQESMSPNEKVFGDEKTLEVVRANRQRPASEIVRALYDAAREFTEGGRQYDDITAVIIKVLDNL